MDAFHSPTAGPDVPGLARLHCSASVDPRAGKIHFKASIGDVEQKASTLLLSQRDDPSMERMVRYLCARAICAVLELDVEHAKKDERIAAQIDRVVEELRRAGVLHLTMSDAVE